MKTKRQVKTKFLLKKSKDPCIASMTYQAIPPESGFNPVGLLFGRKIQTTIPLFRTQLLPTWPFLTTVREKDDKIQKRSKELRLSPWDEDIT